MSENSDDNQKNDGEPLQIKLQSFDSSSNSQDEEDILFSSNFVSKCEFGTKAPTTNRTYLNTDIKEKGLYDSEDFDLQKKNLFGSNNTPIHKMRNKKLNDALSTDPGSIKVKNIKSPKKRYSVFKLVEKDKKYKKEYHLKELKKEIDLPKKKERTDIYGNVINKKNKKKIKVSFIDKITTQPLAEVIDIESFRKFNYVEGLPKEGKMNNLNINCQCCSIF
jgi:hypothetical protein